MYFYKTLLVKEILMYNELTEVDIKKMKEELKERSNILRPKLSDDVKEARSLGDLSENAEYRSAKRAFCRNESRIRKPVQA